MNWIKKNRDGIIILSIFIVIIGFGLMGIWDYLFDFVVYPILSGFSSSNNSDYIPGENFPFQ